METNFANEKGRKSMKKALFCTFCEYNQEYYFTRIKKWYEHVYNLFRNTVDYYVYCDGEVLVDTAILPNVEFISLTPKVGRKSAWVFPGWKRSYYTALHDLIKYDTIIHIENDVIILDNRTLYNCIETKDKSFIAFDYKYNFVEPSIQVLNNKNDRNIIMNEYDTFDKQNENIDFEVKLKSLINWEIMFTSYRLEGEPVFDSEYGAFCQCCDSNEYKSK